MKEWKEERSARLRKGLGKMGLQLLGKYYRKWNIAINTCMKTKEH